MGINAKHGVLASAAALLLVFGAGGGHAFATDPTPEPTTSQSPDDDSIVNTAPPAEPEEELSDAPTVAPPVDLPGEPTPTGKPTSTETPDGNYCGPSHGVYVASSKGKEYHKGVGATNSNYNGTSRTARSTFTSEVTGTVGVSVSGTLKTSASVMVATIEETFNVNLSLSLTAKAGNSISVDTPAHTTSNAKYGVYRLKTVGKSYTLYSNCTTSAKTTVTTYTPKRVGWYLWEG